MSFIIRKKRLYDEEMNLLAVYDLKQDQSDDQVVARGTPLRWNRTLVRFVEIETTLVLDGTNVVEDRSVSLYEVSASLQRCGVVAFCTKV